MVRLEAGDVSEDVAAASIAQAVAGEGVNVERAFTGRANLFAAQAGVLVVDRSAVDRINGVDEAITFATLSAFKPVVEGEMIATVKLIPFGVEAKLRDAAVDVAGKGALRIAPYTIKKVGVVSTLLPGLSPKVIDKTLRVTAERLAPAGASIIAERRVPHDEADLAASIKELLGLGAELVIVFGASAIADRRDVIPAAITEIGGKIEHFGMPVDPGNLLLIGSAGGVPVLGAPGCARSPVENGFDWVLMRLLAGLKVTRAELTGMGVGGLLMEIVTRPQPRTVADLEANRNVAAIVLAAGRSTRMGGPNKLLAEIDGKKLVRIVAEQALASKATDVIVVTGHQADLVEQALAGLNAKFVRNPDFAGGLASSVKAGIAAVSENADGAVVCLGDMPLISAKLIDQLIETFAPDRGHLIAVPVSDGRRGNPVLWSRRFFKELMTLDGDIGARHLIAKHAEAVAEVPVDGQSAFLDIDTPQAPGSAAMIRKPSVTGMGTITGITAPTTQMSWKRVSNRAKAGPGWRRGRRAARSSRTPGFPRHRPRPTTHGASRTLARPAARTTRWAPAGHDVHRAQRGEHALFGERCGAAPGPPPAEQRPRRCRHDTPNCHVASPAGSRTAIRKVRKPTMPRSEPHGRGRQHGSRRRAARPLLGGRRRRRSMAWGCAAPTRVAAKYASAASTRTPSGTGDGEQRAPRARAEKPIGPTAAGAWSWPRPAPRRSRTTVGTMALRDGVGLRQDQHREGHGKSSRPWRSRSYEADDAPGPP